MARLRCLRGLSTLTTFGLAVEIGDRERFAGATIASYVGLVPSEHSSGSFRRLGPITKTGNTHVRRLLGEAACRPYRQPTREMHARCKQAPVQVCPRAHAGNHRLHQRWRRLGERGKKSVVAAEHLLKGHAMSLGRAHGCRRGRRDDHRIYRRMPRPSGGGAFNPFCTEHSRQHSPGPCERQAQWVAAHR